MNAIVTLAAVTGAIIVAVAVKRKRQNKKLNSSKDPYELHIEELTKTIDSKKSIKWTSRPATKDEPKVLEKGK
jgi:ADP-ribosylglycohydrolase